MNYFLTQIEKDEISNIVRLRHILQILSRQGLASSIAYEKESNVDRLRGGSTTCCVLLQNRLWKGRFVDK